MFVRSIFNEPINGVAYQATWRALMKDQDITDKIVEKYPPMCQDENLEQNEDALNNCVDRICKLIGICDNVTDFKMRSPAFGWLYVRMLENDLTYSIWLTVSDLQYLTYII